LILLFFLLFFIIKIKLFFTLWTEMIGIFNDPLPKALIMEKMFAWQKCSFSHILKTYHTGIIMMLFNLLLVNFL